jgi:peroxiredoxin
MDSPAANAAFAKQIDIRFPLLSDMNRKMLKSYGILKSYEPKGAGDSFEWALRTNIVVDKQGIIQFIEEGDSAVDPNSALTMCTTLHKKESAK